ncbi:MAG: hypothetical protein IJL54_01300 [Prevotella sp.]|nr:hypothetical protein [Prevotella sp.]
MSYIVFCVIALVIITGCYLLFIKTSNPDNVIVPTSDCSSCDGSSDKCEQTCMMEASLKEIEYFDDEELDAFKGKPSNEYTDEEADMFSYVMETMNPKEVKDWNRSLCLRGINVPDQIKDEMFMLMET